MAKMIPVHPDMFKQLHGERATAIAEAAEAKRQRDDAIKACRLARYAFNTAIPFGTNPTAREQSRRAIAEAMAAVSTVLAAYELAPAPATPDPHPWGPASCQRDPCPTCGP